MEDKFNSTILPFDKISKNEWESFIKKTNESTYFCTIDYLQLYKNVHFLQIKNYEDHIIAGISFRIISFIPVIGNFFKTCWLESSALVDQQCPKSIQLNLKGQVFDQLYDFLRNQNVVYLYITHWVRSADSEILKEKGFKVKKEATVVFDLSLEKKQFYGNFRKGCKEAYRKAIRKEVVFKVFEGGEAYPYLKEFVNLRKETQSNAIKRNYNASIMLKSEDFVKNIIFGKGHKTYLAITFYKNKMTYAALCVSTNDTVYAYIAGSDIILNRESGAANFLYYQMILFCKENGYKVFDFGGTQINPAKDHPAYGVYAFKNSFGGNLKIYDGGFLLIRKIRGKILNKIINDRGIVRFIYKLFN